jgi:hypothetical protein
LIAVALAAAAKLHPCEADYLTPLLRDTGLALLALYLVKFPRSRFSLDKHEEETIA